MGYVIPAHWPSKLDPRPLGLTSLRTDTSGQGSSYLYPTMSHPSCQVLSCLKLAAWSLELGAWSLELGAWSLRLFTLHRACLLLMYCNRSSAIENLSYDTMAFFRSLNQASRFMMFACCSIILSIWLTPSIQKKLLVLLE